MIRILGIESSCDETAAAVLEVSEETFDLRSNVVASQIKLHARYGGVVPELASRAHLKNGIPVIQEALEQAGCTGKDIDAVAVTAGPGLLGALLVGLQIGKALSYVWDCKLIGVDHLEGHLQAVFLEQKQQPPSFPYLALLVSGGHTALYRVDDHLNYKVLGATRDDAAGEAFDKAAKMLGLSYPGGVAIDKLSQGGDRKSHAFPRGMVGRGLDFSFSGLKTACRIALQKREETPEGQELSDFCASYQEAIVDVLWKKSKVALQQENCKHLVITGGVAANSRLREAFQEWSKDIDVTVHLPSRTFCTDNAAMIAGAGYRRLQKQKIDDLSLNAYSRATFKKPKARKKHKSLTS